jgi:sulfur-oxidizing protein SoxB
MIDAQKALGVDIATGHWEFTYGAERVKQVVENDFKGRIEFLAQNVTTADFGDPVFKPYAIREINGVPVAIVGQAFPYVPIAHPRRFVAEWTFGIKEPELQKQVDEARSRGAKIVVLLSHNGMDVDLKLARRVTGLDAILGGHTHDAVPRPVEIRNAERTTLVTNAGSNGKFLAVLDFDYGDGRVRSWRYRLLPVFSNLLPADPAMDALIAKSRAPYASKLGEKLAVSEGLLYRRGNFNGTVDQLILDALLQVKGAQIAFSPGFRWGTTLLPGDPITFEDVMDWSAITYPSSTLTDVSGEMIKTILEDVCDNLFNPDPYYQQGGDMVRVAGLTYTCAPRETMGRRIDDMRLDGKPIEAAKTYKVAGWAPVGEGVKGEPVWEVIAAYLRDRKSVPPPKLSLPRLVGVEGNPGIAQ